MSTEPISRTDLTDANLPVIDLSRTLDPDQVEGFREDLRRATHDVGFFYLVGHGIPDELRTDLLTQARRFFALPEREKQAIENVRSPHFRGWTRLGGEHTQGHQDWREQIDIGPEAPAVDAPTHPWEVLQGPNQWPASQPELKEVVHRWQGHLSGVAQLLLREWAAALGQPRNVFDVGFDTPSTLIKIVRYPARQDHDQGVGAHSDSGVLTLLWVEPGKGGLQVESRGRWIDAPPIDGALIVNIGELLEVATHGYLKATRHRVISPESDSRISVPFFYNPSLSANIPILELPAELAAEASGVRAEPGNPIHATYGENALKSRLRAHADVARIHHPGLLLTP